MTSRSSELARRLSGRATRWGGLPSLHLDFSARDYVRAVFDGESVPVWAGRTDPADVYASVFCQVLETFAHEFSRRHRETDRHGTWTDCERMAEKVARKCERLPLFQAWLVLSV